MTTYLVAWATLLKAKLFVALVPLHVPILPMDPTSGPIIDYNNGKVSPKLRELGNNVVTNVIYGAGAVFVILAIIGGVRLAMGHKHNSLAMLIGGIIGALFCFLPGPTWDWLFGIVRDITGA